MSWRLIDSGPRDAAFNMALDEALSISVRKGDSPPLLRLYGWSGPAITLGVFQKIEDIDSDSCSSLVIPVIRRPTGGRAILHGDELTYSFSSRNAGIFSGGLMDAYRKIGNAFKFCFDLMGLSCTMKEEREKGINLVRSPLCFASASLGEISSRGMKLVGSAQKRWTDGFLQQGSIPFSIDSKTLQTVFRAPSPSSQQASRVAHHEVLGGMRDLFPNFDAGLFRKHLISAFEETFAVTLFDSRPSPGELELAFHLSFEKYQNPLWTRGEKAGSLSDNKTGISTP